MDGNFIQVPVGKEVGRLVQKKAAVRCGQVELSRNLAPTFLLNPIVSFIFQLENYHLLIGSAGVRTNSAAEVLYAAAWICGEFSVHLRSPSETLRSMFTGRVTSLPGHIQAVFIQNGLKLFSNIVKKEGAEREVGWLGV